MKMQNGSSHTYFIKTMPESGSHILVLQPECDIIMSAKEKQDKKNKLQKRGMKLCGHMKVCFIRFIR